MPGLVALTEGVQVAIVSSAATLGVAGIVVLGEAARRNAKRAREAIGDPNGAGTLVTMVEQVLHAQAEMIRGQAGQDKRIAALERDVHAVRVDVAEIRTDHARLTGRVDGLERTPNRGE